MRDNKYIILAIGVGLSLIILIIFAIANSKQASFLSLESKWLAVAGIPILVALFAGGFIKKFKGFGIELDGELRQPVDKGYLTEAPEFHLQASDVAEQAEEIAKASLDQLYQLAPEKKKKIKRLSFIIQHHYVPEIIEEYFNALPELQFLEIRDQNGSLQCILPKEAIDAMNIQTFVNALKDATAPQVFRPLCVKLLIQSKDSLLVAVEKLRNSGLESLPVLDGKQFTGVLDRSSAFEKLADTLVQTRLKE